MGLRPVNDPRHGRAPALRQWLLPLAVIAVAALAEAGGDPLRSALRYDRAAIGSFELWRLLSAHLAHLGWRHFALNAAGLALVWWLVGSAHSTARWLAVFVVSALGISFAFLALEPNLGWYVGLSGVLHGVLIAGLIPGCVARRGEALLLAAVVAAKLAWEQLAGPLPGSAETAGGNVVVDAHLYGALAGAAAGAALLALDRSRRNRAGRRPL